MRHTQGLQAISRRAHVVRFVRLRRVLGYAAVAAALMAVLAGGATAGTLDQMQARFGSAKGLVGTWDDSAGTPILQSQSFTSGLTGKLDQVDLPLRAVGNPRRDLTVEIRTVADGAPTTTVLASTVVPQAAVPAFFGPESDFTTFSFKPVVFASPASVRRGTSYAIVLVATGAAPTIYTPNRYEWAGVSTDEYPAGKHMSGVGTTWLDDGSPVDLAFTTWVTTTTPTVHFLRPLDQTTAGTAVVINDGSNSRTVPVKVQLLADGLPITGPGSPGAIVTLGAPVEVGCSSGAAIEGPKTHTATGSTHPSVFSWNSEGFWQLNLDLKQLGLARGSCYELDVYLNGEKITNAFVVYRPISK